MTTSGTEAIRHLRLAYSKDWDDDAIEFSVKLEKAAARIQEAKAELAKLLQPLGELTKIQGDLAKAAAASGRLAKAFKEERERREWWTRNREMARLRDVLRKGAAFKNSAGWAKLRFQSRRDFERAEKAAIERLAKVEAEQKAASNRARFRSEIEDLAAKNRRAMVERGVTFDRMV